MRFAYLTQFIIFLSFGVAYGQVSVQTETYIVRNVRSEAESTSSTDAKRIAEGNARLVGFRELISRIVPPEHRAQLPVPTPSEMDDFVISTFDRDTRGGLSSFRVVTDIEYDLGKVHAYLEANGGVSYTNTLPQSILLVPQLIDADGRPMVFDADNSWLSALEQRVSPNSVEWQLPEDTEDVQQMLDSNLIEFQAVESIIESQQADGGYITRVTQKMGDNGDIEGIILQALRVGGAVGPIQIEKQYNVADFGPRAQLFDLYNAAFSDLTNAITDEWLGTVEVAKVKQASVNVVVLATSKEQWFDLSARLEEDHIVDSTRFVQTRQGALDVVVSFRGGLLGLQQLFKDTGYRFEAYSLAGRDDVAGFFLQPLSMRVPSGVILFDMAVIRFDETKF